MSADRSFLAELRIAARVIAVPVSVKDEFELSFAEGFQCCANLIGERCELIVNDKNAVSADRDSDITARALQHIDGAGDLDDFDLDLREIPLRTRPAGGERYNNESVNQ